MLQEQEWSVGHDYIVDAADAPPSDEAALLASLSHKDRKLLAKYTKVKKKSPPLLLLRCWGVCPVNVTFCRHIFRVSERLRLAHRNCSRTLTPRWIVQSPRRSTRKRRRRSTRMRRRRNTKRRGGAAGALAAARCLACWLCNSWLCGLMQLIHVCKPRLLAVLWHK